MFLAGAYCSAPDSQVLFVRFVSRPRAEQAEKAFVLEGSVRPESSTGSMSALWNAIEEIVRAEGLELFDVEVPAGKTGVLRVYISRPKGETEERSAGVQLQNCTAVAKKILDLPNIEDLLPGDHLIEVSSPGVNRKLSRPEHFRGAVGERLRLKIHQPDGKNKVYFGKLLACSDRSLSFEDESTHQPMEISLADVHQARVDFLFD